MDTLTQAQRSERMRLIRSKNTAPELILRQTLSSLGYRYRLHVGGLPGRPDIVFRSRRKVIFVHGCFWHQHPGCKSARVPKSRKSYWIPKLRRNQQRDREHLLRLNENGWKALIVWECQIRHLHLRKRLVFFLSERLGHKTNKPLTQRGK
jgi:DNA mismatch endonuclease (patch repair protein)